MAATPSIDMSGWLHEQLAQASPDLLRAMVTTFAEALMGAEADAVLRRPATVSAAASARIPAMVIGVGSGTPAPAASSWRSRSCGRVRTFRIGCSSAAAAPKPRWSASWRRPTCWA